MSQSDFVTRGQALVSAGQFQEAVKVCRLGLLGRPTTVEGRVVLGQALLALKRFDEVLAEMRVALELDHASVPAQVLKGEALLRKHDGAGALEVLGRLRQQGVADARVAGLYAEAERLAVRSPPGNGAPSLSFTAPSPPPSGMPMAEAGTKHYPAADPAPDDQEDTGGDFTSPTSLAAPNAKKRTPAPAFDGDTPPPAVLAVGDRSGTVEVDPDADGVELRPSQDDLGDLVGPPVGYAGHGARGPSTTIPAPAPSRMTGQPQAQPSARLTVQAQAQSVQMTAQVTAPRSAQLGAQAQPSAQPSAQMAAQMQAPQPPRRAAPEPVRSAAPAASKEEPRGMVLASNRAGAGAGKKPRRDSMFKEEVSTVELDDESMIEVAETLSPDSPDAHQLRAQVEQMAMAGGRPPGPGTQVRNAVKMPSGPLEAQPMVPPQLAQRIASGPHVMSVTSSHAAQPPPSSRIAAAQPTVAALEMPTSRGVGSSPMQAMPLGMPSQAMPLGMPSQAMPQMPAQMMPAQMMPAQMMPPGMPSGVALAHAATQLGSPAFQMPVNPSALAAARPTIALSAQQEQSASAAASAVDALFNSPESGPPPGQQAWAARPRMPHELDPRAAAMVHGGSNGGPGGGPHRMSQGGMPPMAQGGPMGPGGMGPGGMGPGGMGPGGMGPGGMGPGGMGPGGMGPGGPMGMAAAYPGGEPGGDKAPRGRKRSKLQIFLWILIGGAVIGGGVFAGFQIRAMRLHKQIAVARERAVDLAKADTWQGWIGARDRLYSIAQVSATLDNRAALARARAVLGYQFGDGAADAKAAVDQMQGASSVELDLAATYVALTQSDAKAARDTAERAKQGAPSDAEPLYVAGEAELLAGDIKGAIEDHKKAVEREPRPLYAVGLARSYGAGAAWDDAIAALDKYADNPAAMIARAGLMATAGRVVGAPGNDLRGQLAKVIAEGGKPAAEQPRGVSPLQVGLADLALAQIDFARGDLNAARADYRASLELQLNDQRFAEELIDTVYALGDYEFARKAAQLSLDKWPTSRRARTTLAQIWLALGKPNAASDVFAKAADAAAWPKGQTVRGLARQAIGDAEGARADFDAALKKLPGYEPALIARSWLDLAAGDLDDARQRIEPKFNASKAPTAGLLAVYAELQRLGGDPAARDKAKALLEKAAVGPADAGRIQLELARINRDAGDMTAAKAAYGQAAAKGLFEARLEGALLQIDDSDPMTGHNMLEQLLKDSGDHPPANLLLETARARTLVGAHAGAAELLALAEKTPNVASWQLERERARLALRRLDTAGAAQSLVRALDGCGGDLDTFILAADTVATDDKQVGLATKLNALVPVRLKGKPEVDIIAGKGYLATGKLDEAEKVYNAARDALNKEKAAARRRAQAAYGLAAVAYFKQDDPTAKSLFELVTAQDPSIYTAYLFAAEMVKHKAPEDGLRYAQQAAALDPDSLDAWKLVGTLASQLKKPSLLTEAVTRVNDLAPGSDILHQLQQLK